MKQKRYRPVNLRKTAYSIQRDIKKHDFWPNYKGEIQG